MDKPMEVHSLAISQSDLGDDCSAACAMTSVMFCHCLLMCEARQSTKGMIKALTRWLVVGCWIYRTRAPSLRQLTSADPLFKGKSLYLNPGRLAAMVPEIGQSMQVMEEYTGTLYPSGFVSADFEADAAFVRLEEVIRRMAVTAVSKSRAVAATFTCNESTHALCISLCNGVSGDQLCDPKEVTTSSPEECIQLLDALWEGCLCVDFVDSHRNGATRGKGMWLRFHRLADLCKYLRERYPRQPEKSLPPSSIYEKPANSFELCLWQSKPGVPALLNLAVSFYENPGFLAWHEKRTKKRKPHETQEQSSSARQRIEKRLQQLCKASS